MDTAVPSVVAQLVFEYTSPHDLLCIEQTCKRFHSVVSRDSMWKMVFEHAYPHSYFGKHQKWTWKQVFLRKSSRQLAWTQGKPHCLVSQPAHNDGINDIVAQKTNGPFDNLFATCSFDRTVKIWRKPAQRLGSCTPLATLHGHQNAVWSLAWGPQPHELFSASFDGTIRSWDVNQATNTRVLWANADRLLCMVVEEKNIWTGSLTGHMIQWSNASSNPMTGRIQCITPCISSLKKQNHLLYCGGVKHLEIWDERYLNAPLALLKGHEQAIMSIATYSEDILMTVSKDGTLKCWDARGIDPNPMLDVRVHKAAVRSIATCDDIVATSSNDSSVHLWQMTKERTLTKLDELKVHTKQVPSVDLDECHLYTASCDANMTIHEYKLS